MSCFKVAWFNHLYYYTWALGASQESPGTVSASVNDDGSLRTLAPPFKGLVAHEPREVKRSSVFCVLVTSLGTIDFYMRRTPDQTSQSKWHTVPTHAQSIRPVHCTPPSLHALLDTVPIEVFLGEGVSCFTNPAAGVGASDRPTESCPALHWCYPSTTQKRGVCQ